jgi:hypothetical protein
MNFRIKDIAWIIDFLGLFVIGVYCLFSSCFVANFAKVHVVFPFLNFPIFVSEFILLFSVVLLLIKAALGQLKSFGSNRLWLVFALYICFYALIGYIQWGPLALRNAALFYYIWFAFISYQFYRKEFINLLTVSIGVTLITCLLSRNFINGYFFLTLFLLNLILIGRLPTTAVRIFLWIILFVFGNMFMLFNSSRTHLVGCLSTLGFLAIIILFFFVRLRLLLKLILLFILTVVIGIAVWLYADKNGLITLVTPQKIFALHKEYRDYIAEREEYFVYLKLNPQLYHHSSLVINNESCLLKIIQTKNAESSPEIVEKKYRSLGTAYSNILFRIFIWEDMWEELLKKKALFGVGLGEPQRSKNIEILDWASGEWRRDGWITPHNSYFHMIYRLGIIGVLLVILIWGYFGTLVAQFIRFQSINGLLLCGILLYWLMASNFLVILEFPYYAIPFWSLFGLTAAYAQDLKNKSISK